MRSLYVGLPLGALACWLVLAAEVPAQQVTVSTPYHSISEGFFENMGTSWGLGGRNWFFSFGGSPTQAAPQFGGFDPSAGANFGFSRRSGGINGWFNGNWSQGCRRSFVSQTPSITLTNGYPGYMADASVTPFVVSYVPVVGGFPRVGPPGPVPPAMVPSPGSSGVGRDAVLNALQSVRADAAERNRMQNASDAEAEAARMNRPAQPNVLGGAVGSSNRALLGKPAVPPSDAPTRELVAARGSSAGRPAPSVAEARRLHAAEQAAENEAALKYVELARNAEAAGKPNVAKVYYQNAARGATGELREQILGRIQTLDSPPESR
ncbi:MAG TPA: hypothetical protein VMY37_34530 [Thermoguttaceae bacterium]|nr:hypothetical protein [Thermoguttaceae bacterium]